MYTLYWSRLSIASAVQMALEALELEYEIREVDTITGQHRKPEYLAINPAGWIPSLITPEGLILHEAPGIMLYLADRHGRPGLVPEIDDPLRGIFYAKYFFLANDIHPVMKRHYYPHRYSTDAADTPRIKAQSLIAARDRWRVLDDGLAADGPYIIGDRFSVADLYMAFLAGSGFEPPASLLDEFPAVRRCYDLVKARPRLTKLLDTVEAQMREFAALQTKGQLTSMEAAPRA
jgi:glutathione S-transferase